MRFRPSAPLRASADLLPGNMGATLLHLLKTADKLRDELKYSMWYLVFLELENYASALDPLLMGGCGSYFSDKIMGHEFMKVRALDTATEASTVRALQEIAASLPPVDDSLPAGIQRFVDAEWMKFTSGVDRSTW